MLKDKRNPLLKGTYREKSASTGNIKTNRNKTQNSLSGRRSSVEMCDRSQVTGCGGKGRISLKASKERVNHFKRNTT